jgi:hypothetical protein
MLYTSSCPPSEGSSPRRRGAAEGLGAELSIRYRKVSVTGKARRRPEGGQEVQLIEAPSRTWEQGREATEPKEPFFLFLKLLSESLMVGRVGFAGIGWE